MDGILNFFENTIAIVFKTSLIACYFVGIYQVRKHFFVWRKKPIFRNVFLVAYCATYIPVFSIIEMIIIENANPCINNGNFAYFDEMIYLYVVSFLIKCVFILHVSFYVSIPAKKMLIKNSKDNNAIKWAHFKTWVLIAMFLVPILIVMVDLCSSPSLPPNLP